MSPQNALEPQDSSLEDTWPARTERRAGAEEGTLLWRLALAAALAVVALAAAGSLLA